MRFPEPIAEDVWLVRGGVTRDMNVYLVRDRDGVALFDAGIGSMVKQLKEAARPFGGITRILLGHSHVDHRGAAPGLGVPVLCHEDERADAEGDGGRRYQDLSKLDIPARFVYPKLMSHWDGGPVRITETVREGDSFAGFEVIHAPGHAPGLVALWRERDRLALTSDIFYTLDPQTGRKGRPRLAHPAFGSDQEQARASLRKLAALEPAAAWPGHAKPVIGYVRDELERAADNS